MRDPQVVRTPFVHWMSLSAMGMPVSGLMFPLRIPPSAFFASSKAYSFIIVVKERTRSSTASMRLKTSVTISVDVTSFFLSFSCNSCMVSSFSPIIDSKRFSFLPGPYTLVPGPLFNDLRYPIAVAALGGGVGQRELGGKRLPDNVLPECVLDGDGVRLGLDTRRVHLAQLFHVEKDVVQLGGELLLLLLAKFETRQMGHVFNLIFCDLQWFCLQKTLPSIR